jgi:tellurite resistance protein
MPNSKSLSTIDFNIPDEIEELFGDPPVLTLGELVMHEAIVLRYAKAVKPRDFVEWCFVRDLTDHRVESQRFRRLKARLELQAHTDKLQEQANAITHSGIQRIRNVREAGAAELADKIKQLRGEPDEIKAETEKLKTESEKNLKTQCDAIQTDARKQAEENERAFSVEESSAAEFAKWIGKYQEADRCLIAAERKYKETLRDIEDYRRGLGELLRQADDQIIDGEFEEDVNSTQETQPEVPALRLAAVPPVKELPEVAQAPTTAPVAVAGAGGSNP